MSNLIEQLPQADARLSRDEVLDRFVAYASAAGLSLYPAQEEAILELLGSKHLVLATPTGSGKSLVALAFHFMALAEGRRSFYTCPIKALVNEKFFALCDAFGAERVGMMTGDASINKDAPIICCTAEILSNLCLRDQRQFADCVVMDEFHYYGDKDRGVAWQIPLLTLSDTTFLLMSATLGDLTSIKAAVTDVTHREFSEVRSTERPVPLEFRYAETPLHETVQELLSSAQAPVYLVNFSQRAAAEQAQNLLSVDFLQREEKDVLKAAVGGFHFDTPFGKDLRRLLLHGVGLHHAGLLPKYRRLVERLAQQGLLKVISGTDTLGVGVNVPIRTVLFTQLCKYDGEKTGVLTVRDFQQIAGRAGRKGFDTRGAVVAQAPAHVIENARLAQKKDAGKKVVMQKPPTKGYVHWDRATFDKLMSRAPEPLESRFNITHGLLVNLLQASAETGRNGYRRLVELVALSHTPDGTKARLLKHARLLFRSLIGASLVIVERREGARPAQARVAEGLQRDFSLNHTLSLYLLEAMPMLDAAAPTHALDVLSLVEAILESPDVVLYAQLDRLKDEKVAELKAQGVEYAQRMEELEKLEWPKPNRDFTYGTFDSFAAKHPWVGQENIRPKSVARDLFERCMTFNEYVKEYGIQRSEGVLLRYFSDVYKTLAQNVPEALRTEGIEDVLSFLSATLRQVDSSLLDEWEAMRDGRTVTAEQLKAKLERPEPKRSWWEDPRAVKRHLRAQMHQLTGLLGRKKLDEAAEMLGAECNPKELEAQMQPVWQGLGDIDLTPRGRSMDLTFFEPEGAEWKVVHKLLSRSSEVTAAVTVMASSLGLRLQRVELD